MEELLRGFLYARDKGSVKSILIDINEMKFYPFMFTALQKPIFYQVLILTFNPNNSLQQNTV